MHGPDTESQTQSATINVNNVIVTLSENIPYDEPPLRKIRVALNTHHHSDESKVEEVHQSIVSSFRGENLHVNLVQLWKELKKQYNAILQKLSTPVESNKLVLEMHMFSQRGYDSYKREVLDGRFSRILMILLEEMSEGKIDSSELSFKVKIVKDERFTDPTPPESPTSSTVSFGDDSYMFSESMAFGGFSGDPYGTVHEELLARPLDSPVEPSTSSPITEIHRRQQLEARPLTTAVTSGPGSTVSFSAKQLQQVRNQLEVSLSRRLSDVKNTQEKDKMEILRRIEKLETVLLQENKNIEMMQVAQKQILDEGLQKTRSSLQGLSEKFDDMERLVEVKIQELRMTQSFQLETEKIHELAEEVKDFRKDFSKFQDETLDKFDVLETTVKSVKDSVEKSSGEVRNTLLQITKSLPLSPSSSQSRGGSDSQKRLEPGHYNTRDQTSVHPENLTRGSDRTRLLKDNSFVNLSNVNRDFHEQEREDFSMNIKRPQTLSFEHRQTLEHEVNASSRMISPVESRPVAPELESAIKETGILEEIDQTVRKDLYEPTNFGNTGPLQTPQNSSELHFKETLNSSMSHTSETGNSSLLHPKNTSSPPSHSSATGNSRSLRSSFTGIDHSLHSPPSASSTTENNPVSDPYSTTSSRVIHPTGGERIPELHPFTTVPFESSANENEERIMAEIQRSLHVGEELVIEANELRKSSNLPLTKDILKILTKGLKDIREIVLDISDGGIDTILCLDLSASTKGKPVSQLISVVTDLLNDAEELSVNRDLRENIGIVVCGAKTEILSPLTIDYIDLVEKVCNLNASGTSPLHTALVLCNIALKDKGGPMSMGGYIVPPRIVLFSDGRPTDDSQMHNEFTEKGTKPSEIGERVKNMASQLHHQGYTVFTVPVGEQLNRAFLQDVANLGGGKLVNMEDCRFIKKYFHYQVIAGNVIQKCHEMGNTQAYSELIQREVNQRHSGLDKDDIIHITEIIHTSKELDDEEHDNLPPLGTRVQILSGEATSDPLQYGTVIQNLPDGWIKVQLDDGLINFYHYGNSDHEDVKIVSQPRQLRKDQLIEVGIIVCDIGKPDKKGMTFRVTNSGFVYVRWEDGSRSRSKYGADGEFNLEILEESRCKQYTWQWEDFTTQQWIDFDHTNQHKIEQAFQKNDKTCVVDVNKERARIIFERGQMKLIDRHEVLSVRRIADSSVDNR